MDKKEALRYPIGRFEYGKTYSLAQTREHISIIEHLPNDLKKSLRKIGRNHFDDSYRPGGWTVRQVVHHLADSHMNAFIRMKMALTEPTPVIKPYEQDLWAQTADVLDMPVKVSLRLLSALHRRWVALLESLTEEDLEKGYFNPEQNTIIFLPEAIALYAWHCRHHVAHLNIVAQNVAAGKAEKRSAKTATGAQPAVAVSREPVKVTKRARQQSEKTEEMPADKPKLTRAEALAIARAARAAKRAQQASEKTQQPTADKPKLTRAEALAIARAARAAKRAQQAGEKTQQPTADKPKLTRAEALAIARAARAAKRAQQTAEKTQQPTADKPKLTRAEALAIARAARAAKRKEQEK